MAKHAGKRFAPSGDKTKRKVETVDIQKTAKVKKTPQKGWRPLYYACSLVACLLVIVLGVFCVYQHYYGMLNYSEGSYTAPSGVVSDEDIVQEGTEVSGEVGELITSMQEDMDQYDVLNSDEVTNILLLGVDDRDNAYNARTDTMILVSICNKTDRIYLTSFMRDTWVYIPGQGYSRMNAANAWGGPQLVMDTIEENFKVQVDSYAMVNFYTFIDVVNAVGGVTMELTDGEAYYVNEYSQGISYDGAAVQVEGGMSYLPGGGTYRLNGVQALSYCRIRVIGDDFERTNRQRKVIDAVFEEAKQMGVGEISELVEIIFPQITTNITSGEVLDLCFNAPAYLSYEMISQRVPADGTWYNFTTSGGAQVLGVDLSANIQILHGTIYPD